MPAWQEVPIAGGKKWWKGHSNLACLALFANLYMFSFFVCGSSVRCIAEEENKWLEDVMRRWGRQISKLWKRKAVFQIWPWPWPGKVNPAMHRPLQSWADEASDERGCFGLPVTSENFPGLRTKLYMEICCKWAVLMWLGRLWILPYAGALRKCECSYFSLRLRITS